MKLLDIGAEDATTDFTDTEVLAMDMVLEDSEDVDMVSEDADMDSEDVELTLTTHIMLVLFLVGTNVILSGIIAVLLERDMEIAISQLV